MAKFIRFEAVGKMIRDTRCELRGVSISITKFTEMGWNDGVFEGSKEHLDVLGSALFFLLLWILIFFKRKDFFILIMFLREQSWRNSFAMKRGENWCGDVVMWWCDDAMMWSRKFVNLRNREVMKLWNWNLLLDKKILHYAVLRSEWHGSVLYSRIRNMNYQCF